MKRAALPLFILGIGLVFAILMVFQQQIFQQHANVVTLKAFAVKGSVYLDTNTNGQKEAIEKNYTGEPKPLVRLALFTEVCRPTPTPKVSGTPTPTVARIPTSTPTLAPGCQYICPKVACIRLSDGSVKCPSCTTVCASATPTPQVSRPVANGGKGVQGAEDTTVGKVVSSTVSNSDDVKDMDACRERPERVVPCTVNEDGTYSCIVNDVTFSRASLILNAPAGYAVTTHNNPFNMKAEDYAKNPTAVVDFGIAKEGTLTPPAGCYYRAKACGTVCPTTNPNCCPRELVCTTPTPKVSRDVSPSVKPSCIPQPDCLHSGKCTYPTPPQGWCAYTGKPLTNDETNRLLIYLNTLLRKGQ